MIELMVVVAIGAIVAAIAIGGLSHLIPRSQVKSAAQKLQADLQKAKLEAVKSNEDALVTFTAASGGSQGSYQACFDNDSDGSCDAAAGDTMIAENSFTDNNYKHALLSNVAFSLGGTSVQFDSRGMPNGNGTIDITCSSDASYSLSIVISRTGRIRIN